MLVYITMEPPKLAWKRQIISNITLNNVHTTGVAKRFVYMMTVFLDLFILFLFLLLRFSVYREGTIIFDKTRSRYVWFGTQIWSRPSGYGALLKSKFVYINQKPIAFCLVFSTETALCVFAVSAKCVWIT